MTFSKKLVSSAKPNTKPRMQDVDWLSVASLYLIYKFESFQNYDWRSFFKWKFRGDFFLVNSVSDYFSQWTVSIAKLVRLREKNQWLNARVVKQVTIMHQFLIFAQITHATFSSVVILSQRRNRRLHLHSWSLKV